MYNLLLKIYIAAAILQFGLTLTDIENCTKGNCDRFTIARDKVLKIDWKPISVFPKEAYRFR